MASTLLLFEACTTSYDDDIVLIKRALSHLETRCGGPGTCVLGRPVSRFGWTFFQIAIKAALADGIEKEFADMLQRYRDGRPEERIARFLADYVESKGCKMRLRVADE